MNANQQQDHYDRLASLYERHYFDATSMKYRDEFLYAKMFGANFPWAGARIVELACGAGHNARALMGRHPGARVEGIDISPATCDLYRRNTGQPAYVRDLTRPFEEELEPYDAAFVIGGLHHCIKDMRATLENAARLVRPGGLFVMMEPNNRFFLERPRQWWYRWDSMFVANEEAALDHGALARMAQDWFEPQSVLYNGGPAFFLILNSMILRIPLGLKPWIAPPALALERLWNKMPMPFMQNYFIAHWRRKPTEV